MRCDPSFGAVINKKKCTSVYFAVDKRSRIRAKVDTVHKFPLKKKHVNLHFEPWPASCGTASVGGDNEAIP